MSVNYGGPPAGGAAYGGGGCPPRRCASLEWINEVLALFFQQAGTWIVSCIVAVLLCRLVLYFILCIRIRIFEPAFGSVRSTSNPKRRSPRPGLSAGLIIFLVLFWIGLRTAGILPLF